MAILDVQHIEKHFGDTPVLKDISFSLEEGQALSIIGSSGSGKTTLLRCLNFLETPDNGVISVRGETLFDANDPDTKRESDIRKKRLHFGMVFQSFNLFPQYTALENVTLARQLMAKTEKTGESMESILAEGKDIVSINFSSALSTTYQSACIAAHDMKEEFPDANIYVVDSLSASLGQGLLLYLAAHKKQEGLSAQELVQWVEDNKLHIDHWFTVDDLNYLKMGGRVSATTAFLGTMLSIKPVMHTSDEGKLVPVGKARGRKAAIKALLDKIETLGIHPENQTMFICHADCELDARAVAQQIKERFGTKTVYINYIGPVIGSHTGPNTMGIFFVGTQR